MYGPELDTTQDAQAWAHNWRFPVIPLKEVSVNSDMGIEPVMKAEPIVLEFNNADGTYDSLMAKNGTEHRSFKMLEKLGFINPDQKEHFKNFISTLGDYIKRDSAHPDHKAMVQTIEAKMGNMIGALCYAANLPHVSKDNLGYLVYGLTSIQFMADYGDTVSDTSIIEEGSPITKENSINTIKSNVEKIYNLDGTYAEDSSETLRFIRTNIKNLFSFSRDIDIGPKYMKMDDLFRVIWDEFVTYQLATIAEDDNSYLNNLENSFSYMIENRRLLSLGTRDYENNPRNFIEFMSLKGGTTYLHNLARLMISGEKVENFDLFESEMDAFALLNFMCDHYVDIATDNGYVDFDDMRNGRISFNAINHKNAIHIIIMRKLKNDIGVEKIVPQIMKLYEKEVNEFFLDLLERAHRIVSMTESINYHLFKPMVMFFFAYDKPSLKLANMVREKIKLL